MKRRFLAIGLMIASMYTFGQSTNGYTKRKVSDQKVQALFSYYTQDGNHSAVTGGIGTEDLQVYSTQLSYTQTRDSLDSWHITLGTDVISSASTDKIDFEMSSASLIDLRGYLKTSYDRTVKGTGSTLGIDGAFSLETDYLSFGTGLSWSHLSADQSREISAHLQVFLDGLRWFDHAKLSGLIYPIEMRNTKWFDITHRNSFNLSLSIHQVLNQRMSLGIYPGVSYQEGLLSTPFHRVYFTDNSKKVENLPMHRLKFPLGLQLNSFITGRWILRTYYGYYSDNFGISAHTVNLESPFKITPMLTVTPLLRFYTQTASRYFNLFKMHDPAQEFYTSDYDLSHFHSIKPGMAIRYAPFRKKKRNTFNEIELRYAFYDRSDGLKAHVISLFLEMGHEGGGKK